jgi:DNA-binding transcriptional LysR family regulator
MDDPFDGMAVFVRVVEAGGFTQAAADLGLTKSTVSEAVRGLC